MVDRCNFFGSIYFLQICFSTNEPASGIVSSQAAGSMAAPSLNRTIITIPKAMVSMTTISTCEDYIWMWKRKAENLQLTKEVTYLF